jgi:membrane-associated protease RseP (regulator of RpoE activity)
MGLPSPSDRPTPGYAAFQRDYVPPPPEPDVRRQPIVRHLVLFALTVISTTLVGAGHYAVFQSDFAGPVVFNGGWGAYAQGLWYSAAILAILGAHEFGHYYACRYYRVDASLPYFLPVPFLLTGTLGAFIRIRQPIPNKRELFDIGIAGPIAGFLVAVPVLVLGVALSKVVKIPPTFDGLELGEPLLLKSLMWLHFGSPPQGYSVSLHPMAFAGWFGLLATALNLFPFGQLDGGHISYAVLGRRSTQVTYATFACLIGLALLAPYSWTAWMLVAAAMLYFLGPEHPRTYDEGTHLDTGRLWLAGFAVVMFVLCFTPVPVSTLDMVGAP